MKRLAIAICLLLAGCHQPSFRYKVGDVVETKLARIRGTVVAYRDGCGGVYVRFVTVSMTPVCILEIELQAARQP